jgi:ribosomal protein L40E
MPETKFCRHCGASIAPHAQFCNKCGKDQMAVTQARQEGRPVEPRIDERGEEQLNESYRHSGHEVLKPFQLTVVQGVQRFAGTTRHPNGYQMQIHIYVANSFANALGCKKQLSERYEALGYTARKIAGEEWVGVAGRTLVSIAANKDSLFGVPTTGVIAVSTS